MLISCEKSNKTILQIGNLTISKHTYNRELNKVIQNNLNGNTDIDKWQETFVNDCFIISDAINQKYDTITSLNDELNIISQIMMVQKYGYLWQKTVSPIVDNFKTVTKEKINIRNKLLFADIIYCTNIDSLRILMNDSLNIVDKEGFNKLKHLCNQKSYLNNNYISISWPFGYLYKFEKEITSLVPGKISMPLTDNNTIMYIYLDHIEKININEKEIQKLSSELQSIKEEEIDKKKELEMDESGKLLIFEDSLFNVLEHISNQSAIKFNPVIAEYEFENKKNHINLISFVKYMKYNPYKRTIRNINDLKKYIRQYFYNQYLSNEAKGLGLYESEEFKFDKQYFHYKLLLRQYINDEIVKNVNVDSIEMFSYYKNNIIEFKIANGANVNIYTFTSNNYAQKGLKEIAELINSFSIDEEELKKIEGLDNYEKSQIINYNNSAYPEKVISSLKDLSEKELSLNIYPFRNKYIVIYKNNSVENFAPSYELINKSIYYKLLGGKITEFKNTKVQELKNILHVDINKTGIPIK